MPTSHRNSSSKNQPDTNNDDFPFDHVVISFPDACSAACARNGPLQELAAKYPLTRITATCDPYNVRMGSGGGSLACLATTILYHDHEQHDAANNNNANDSGGSVLILHAGGESSRCPTQMVLGKAWTSLPIVQDDVKELQTPIHLWLRQCCELFGNKHSHGSQLPRNSIVIVAADTLLQLPRTIEMDWSRLEDDCEAPMVVGLAVPAPFETAKNHGVYVVDSSVLQESNGADADNDAAAWTPAMSVLVCHQVLQKPTIETLQRTLAHVDDDDNNAPYAWIDTGVCVFLPRAAKALRALAVELDYSADGWKQKLLEYASSTMTKDFAQEDDDDDENAVRDFARRHAVSLDLYTHILQALRVEQQSSNRTLEYYAQQFADKLPLSVATSIYNALSACQLHVACVKAGQFLHLGTTRELMEFLVQGSGSRMSEDTIESGPRRTRLQTFGRELGLCRRLDWFATQAAQVDPSAVIFHSLIKSHTTCPTIVGAGTIIEHSHIETAIAAGNDNTATHPKIQIGQNCLVSGLRKYGSGIARDGLELPDGMILHQIALAENSAQNSKVEAQSYVYVVLGVNDAIKERNTFYGRSFVDIQQRAGFADGDVWTDGAEKILWNAKVHPVVTVESFSDVFGWLHLIMSDESVDDDVSLQHWKKLHKLSLSEIRHCSDASAEFSFRTSLPKVVSMQSDMHLAKIRKIFMTRQHAMVDLQFFLSSYAANGDSGELLRALEMLDELFDEALNEDMFDVCGRVAMLASSFLSEAVSFAPSDTDVIGLRRPVVLSDQSDVLSFVATNSDMRASYRRFVTIRNDCLPTHPQAALQEASGVMESISRAMTRRCIGSPEQPHVVSTRKPIYDRWVLSAAPARVDLGGGWSDTPPICFEFGSAVIGMAVLVEGIKPLSCRCRILTGEKDVLLRTEQRDAQTGELHSYAEVHMTSTDDLKDHCIPTADCALLKCALICLGLVKAEVIFGGGISLQPFINAFCQSGNDVGIEIVSTSLLPHGSGMGTSSILGGCVLSSIGRAVDMVFACGEDNSRLIVAVLQLEQLLTTGGGFQDQVNGLVRGCKYVTCVPFAFPFNVHVERLPLQPHMANAINNSFVLLFTGKTRLAKNILQSVLCRWASRTVEITSTVQELASSAGHCREALISGDLDGLGHCVSAYWALKKAMAGEDGGAEPPFVRDILSVFRKRKVIRGATLCGAGGGGFMALIINDGVTVDELNSLLIAELGSSHDMRSISWHTCKISEDGLSTRILDKTVTSIQAYDTSWLRPVA